MGNIINASLAGVELKTPTILASGFLGVNSGILKRAAECGAGAVTTKSIGFEKRDGHNNPTVFELEAGTGLINAVGLPTPGFRNMEEEWLELKECKVPVIASIFGASVQEFVEVAEFVAGKKPAMIELNISCPNSKSHGQLFGTSKEASFEVTSAVKNVIGKIPLMPKLSPQALNIAEIGKACEEAGADALCAINTLGPGMVINIEARKPVLHYKTGGLSGPAIKPIAVRCVWQLFESVKIPILGLGGITNGRDAVEIIQAGASAVGVGTAIHYNGIEAFGKINSELEDWMQANGFSSIEKLRGIAHD
ncbi:MAG: dihydroorotate dehydrogenase [Candidatus Diapherotrites archaeon]|nr:dihydroorotate dehydrogenase [Candidatus Diapherotrites archaeon]